MRSAKPHTNATFTRRVDHGARGHGTARARRERAVCAGCGAVSRGGRWTRGEFAHLVLARWHGEPLEIRLCSRCVRRRTGLPRGYVHVTGAFFAEHRAEVERLLRNELRRARDEDPSAQMIDWESYGLGGLLITTSTEHLAQHLGRALVGALGGTVHFGFVQKLRMANVWWNRD